MRPSSRFGLLDRMRMSVCLALAAMGCTATRAPLPLDPTETAAPVVSEPAPAMVEEEDEIVTLEEEPLFDETAVTPDSVAPGGALPLEPPAVEHTITTATPPNVAAATRLVAAGRARIAAEEYGAALEQLERAIAIDPSNPYAYYYLAELHLRHRTYDQAIEFADRAASLSAARAPDWASRAYALQGNAFEAVGRFADARRAYTRAIQAAPGNLAAQVGLARVGSAVAQP